MNTLGRVQGVQGCAGLYFSSLHTRIPCISGPVADRVECAGFSRAQACVHKVFLRLACVDEKKSYARPQKACTPYTLCTKQHNRLIYKDFICVGFVLGCVFFVLDSVFRGEGQ